MSEHFSWSTADETDPACLRRVLASIDSAVVYKLNDFDHCQILLVIRPPEGRAEVAGWIREAESDVVSYLARRAEVAALLARADPLNAVPALDADRLGRWLHDEDKGDEQLSVELDQLDRYLNPDGAAALRAQLVGAVDLEWLLQGHERTLRARRAVVVELLSDAAMPRRLASFDRVLEGARNELAAARETQATVTEPAARKGAQEDVDRLAFFVDLLGEDRASLAARLADGGSSPRAE